MACLFKNATASGMPCLFENLKLLCLFKDLKPLLMALAPGGASLQAQMLSAAVAGMAFGVAAAGSICAGFPV
jgi:hypothetical protein